MKKAFFAIIKAFFALLFALLLLGMMILVIVSFGGRFALDLGSNDFPEFPWPPPLASARENIRNELLLDDSRSPLLQDVDQKLCRALDSNGYSERSYYAVPQGFALVTRLEQIYADGTPMEEQDRWAVDVRPLRKFTLEAYLRALFQANPGHYRIIVFVVTSMPFPEQRARVTRDEAMLWLTDGLNRLPNTIGNRLYTQEYACTAMIYEFLQAGKGSEAKARIPGLPARDHLNKAKLLPLLSTRGSKVSRGPLWIPSFP
jgi:hypothetical protein